MKYAAGGHDTLASPVDFEPVRHRYIACQKLNALPIELSGSIRFSNVLIEK